MTKEEFNEISNKLIKLANKKSEEDSYNKGYVDGLYQALRVVRAVYFDIVYDKCGNGNAVDKNTRFFAGIGKKPIDGRSEMCGEAKEEMKFEVKIDEDFLKECERNDLIDYPTKVYLNIGNEQIVYTRIENRPKGKWKKTTASPHWLYCDQCYKRIVPNVNWIDEYNIPTNYCPNCGACMIKPNIKAGVLNADIVTAGMLKDKE